MMSSALSKKEKETPSPLPDGCSMHPICLVPSLAAAIVTIASATASAAIATITR